ncbi:flagellar motor protein MotB [Mesorhizobium sp. L2C089B000]|nr:flagellar motor protein MotB [Mesorhizobium sp. L2C089B000]ESZ25399.1 flagellar motor protein MotB [Mesorhizobium sp. L2C067A000]
MLEAAMRIGTSFLVLATVLASSNSFADPVQTSEDIVKFFGNATDLGPSRGICIGTEDECKSKADASVPTGLDMLINFSLDSAELQPEARTKLGEFAKALKDNRLRAHNFIVEGHTDASGSAIYNQGLSERRAQSVTAFLLSNGIEPSRIRAIGEGKSHPRVADPYDPVNRRVEMRINLP